MMGGLALGAWLGAIPSCGDDGGAQVGHTPPPPATTGAGTTTGSTGEPGTSSGGPTPCELSSDCGADEACAADFMVGDEPPSTADFSCRAQCVPVGAVALWCADDRACCEGICNGGTCEGQAPATGATGTSSGSGDGSEGSSSGTGTGGGSSSTG